MSLFSDAFCIIDAMKQLLIIVITLLAALGFLFLGERIPEKEEETPAEETIEVPAQRYSDGGEILLAKGESRDLSHFHIEDPSILSSEDGKVTGKKNGTTVLYDDENYIRYTVEVSDLIIAPTIGTDREALPCGRYSEEENDALDELLKKYIENAGYHTRAGVVEAARFLTLRFPYHMNYFYENGRIDSGRISEADGEGRYYHEGLYLHESRFDKIETTVSGKEVWGCPLYSYDARKQLNNSFDCSGFLSWAFLNGGYDIGDIGAGTTEEADFTDIGKLVPLEELKDSILKPGDLFGMQGHIAILIGIDEDHYYIAHSYYDDGLEAFAVTKEEAMKEGFDYAILLDSYYNGDGELTMMWPGGES